MTVISLTDCPPKVRGDLTKWLFEINTGVFVGNINVRVRERLWLRICENVRSGRVTMVFNAPGEQKLDFLVHNTTWEPVDYDGIKLMRRPAPKKISRSDTASSIQSVSKAAQYEKIKRINTSRLEKAQTEPYVVIDIETTGLSETSDSIIELGALRIESGKVTAEFSTLVLPDTAVPEHIYSMTNITVSELNEKGVPAKNALSDFLAFIKDDRLVGHNISFDIGFLRVYCKKHELKIPVNRAVDTLVLARRKLDDIDDFKLTTIAESFGFETSGTHRALADCYLTYKVYTKLNEI